MKWIAEQWFDVKILNFKLETESTMCNLSISNGIKPQGKDKSTLDKSDIRIIKSIECH